MNLSKSVIGIVAFVFVTFIVTLAPQAQRKVGSSPYSTYYHPANSWPKTARTLSLGYFNVLGDGIHPDFAANPALTADIKGYYVSTGFYRDPVPEEGSPSLNDHFYQFSFGKSLNNFLAVQFNTTSFGYEYNLTVYQFGVVTPITDPGPSYDYAYNSKSYSGSIGFRPSPDILFGVAVSISLIQNLGGAVINESSANAFGLDFGMEIRNLSNNVSSFSKRESPKFYDKWHNSRIPGINFALVLRNVGQRPEFQYGYTGFETQPLELKTGLSWLLVNTNDFGFEIIGNYMRDLKNGDYYDRLRRFSYSGAIEITTINLVQIRFGHFNIVDEYKSFTWGFSVGPPFLKLEYGKISNFGAFENYLYSKYDRRDILTLTLNHTFGH